MKKQFQVEKITQLIGDIQDTQTQSEESFSSVETQDLVGEV